jgi:hypothetical protein
MMLGLLASAAALAGSPTGVWVLSEPAEVVQARIDAAVEESAAEFGIFRAIARPRLKKVAIWCRQYTIDFEADPISYQCDDIDPLQVAQAQLGTAFMLSLPKGEVQTTMTWSDPSLRIEYAGEDGGRTNVFSFPGEGSMALTVTVNSARLSAPLSFSIPYKAAR